MEQDMSYGKLKPLFVNIIAVLYKTTALNIHRLHSDLREIKAVINSAKPEVWIGELFIFLISILILLRFLTCFLGLASNIVATYPILTNSQPELLMPTIIMQIIDNFALSIFEIVLGYASLKYLFPESFSVFLVFLVKMSAKLFISISVLNVFSEKQNAMSSQANYHQNESNLDRESSEEMVISNQVFESIA